MKLVNLLNSLLILVIIVLNLSLFTLVHTSNNMAPGILEQQPVSETRNFVKSEKLANHKEAFAQSAATTDYEGELKGIGKHAPAQYPHYLPVWEDTTYPPLEVFEHYEHGKDADPSLPFLKGAEVEDLCANIGAEVKGVQLSKLDKAGQDQLALFVAQKKVVGE